MTQVKAFVLCTITISFLIGECGQYPLGDKQTHLANRPTNGCFTLPSFLEWIPLKQDLSYTLLHNLAMLYIVQKKYK